MLFVEQLSTCKSMQNLLILISNIYLLFIWMWFSSVYCKGKRHDISIYSMKNPKLENKPVVFPIFFFWKLGFQLGGIIESSQGRSQLLVVSGWFSTKEYTCSFLCCSKGWKRGDLGESYVCWRQQRGPRPVVWCTVHTVSCQKPCLLRTCLCMAISNTDAASQLVFCLPPSQQLVHFTHLRIMCNSHVFHQLFMFVVFPQHFCKNLDSSWIVSTQVY